MHQQGHPMVPHDPKQQRSACRIPQHQRLQHTGGQIPGPQPGQTQHTTTPAMSDAAATPAKKAAKALPTSLHFHYRHGNHYLEREWWFLQEAQSYVYCVLQRDRLCHQGSGQRQARRQEDASYQRIHQAYQSREGK